MKSEKETSNIEYERRRAEDKEAMKVAMKETLREWLDEKYATFGKWSFHSLLAIILVALLYFVLLQNGWQQLPTHHVVKEAGQ